MFEKNLSVLETIKDDRFQILVLIKAEACII